MNNPVTKTIATIAALLPVIIGIGGCYIFTWELMANSRYGIEGAIASGYYTFWYIFGFMSFVLSIGMCSLVFLLPLIRLPRHKLEIVFLFLLFLALLVITPFIVAFKRPHSAANRASFIWPPVCLGHRGGSMEQTLQIKEPLYDKAKFFHSLRHDRFIEGRRTMRGVSINAAKLHSRYLNV